FFFSSRRRHTRCYRDWSSDVCSSDLSSRVREDWALSTRIVLASARAAGAAGTILVLSAQSSRTLEEVAQTATGPLWFQQYFFKEIGRASCRERLFLWMLGV